MDRFQPAPQEIKVLLVDDLVANAQLLAEILQDEGYQTAIASSGQEALAKTVSEKPNVVLLDVMMPDLDGFEVCRRIKAQAGTSFLPVIMLTALSSPEHRIRGQEAGADEFMTKPPAEQDLLLRVRCLARMQWLHQALAACQEQFQSEPVDQPRSLPTGQIASHDPLAPLMLDPAVNEIVVNGPHQIYAEHRGRLYKTGLDFESEEHLLRALEHLIQPLGLQLSGAPSVIEARLPDGTWIHAVLPPCAVDGPSLVIRKSGQKRDRAEDLVGLGSMTPQIAHFLEACVRSRANILVSGEVGSGKTCLLNVLTRWIPGSERVVTVEDPIELWLDPGQAVRLEARPAGVEGAGRVPSGWLVGSALRMRPERLVVGEVCGDEAWDVIQAMNQGLSSLTTIYGSSPREAIARLESLALLAGFGLPAGVVRAQIATAVDLVVQQARLRDGSRRVVALAEVQGVEGDEVVLSQFFTCGDWVRQAGRVATPAGARPGLSEKLARSGYRFQPETLPTRDRSGGDATIPPVPRG